MNGSVGAARALSSRQITLTYRAHVSGWRREIAARGDPVSYASASGPTTINSSYSRATRDGECDDGAEGGAGRGGEQGKSETGVRDGWHRAGRGRH